MGEGDFDTPFYVTAHEVAHQWWAHQLTGANLPGSEVLSESLAEYTALRVAVLAGNHPSDVYRRAADAYLKGRAEDREEERPLVTTRRQPYLCYQKGGLAFQELRWLTRQRLDTVLRGFLERLAFQEPPYVTTQVLVDVLKQSFPAHAPRITELFEKITLNDLKVGEAKATQVGKNRWRTVFTVTAKKVYADGLGNETPAPLQDTVAVSLWTKTEVVTLPITLLQNQQVCTLETRFRPAFVRLDPSYSQLDRERENNTADVE